MGRKNKGVGNAVSARSADVSEKMTLLKTDEGVVVQEVTLDNNKSPPNPRRPIHCLWRGCDEG